MLFFHEPNHKRTSFKLFLLLVLMRLSTNVKSNLPSSGSVSSQYTGERMVFKFIALNLLQNGRIYPIPDAVELPNSPPKTRNGLSSTTSSCVVPFVCK